MVPSCIMCWLFTRCFARKTWSTLAFSCQDIESWFAFPWRVMCGPHRFVTCIHLLTSCQLCVTLNLPGFPCLANFRLETLKFQLERFPSLRCLADSSVLKKELVENLVIVVMVLIGSLFVALWFTLYQSDPVPKTVVYINTAAEGQNDWTPIPGQNMFSLNFLLLRCGCFAARKCGFACDGSA